ncbi:MAG: ArsC/Spx/MgsR family protein [Christiangramia sp.]
MGEIATSNWEVILFYNPNSVIGRKALAYAEAEGFAVRDVDILKTPFTGTQIEELAERLHISLGELVNKQHPDFKKSYANPNLNDDDWIKILRKHPEFIREPIAIRGHKTILVKTPSDIIKL